MALHVCVSVQYRLAACKSDWPSKNSRVFSTDMRKWRIHGCYFGHLARIQNRHAPKNSRVFSTDMRKWRIHGCYFGHLARIQNRHALKNSRVFSTDMRKWRIRRCRQFSLNSNSLIFPSRYAGSLGSVPLRVASKSSRFSMRRTICVSRFLLQYACERAIYIYVHDSVLR